MTRGSVLMLGLFAAACATAGLGPPPGQAALAPAEEAELKTLAVRGVHEEMQRVGANGPGRLVIFLDTLVGPTPAEFMYDWTHRPEWLEAMRTTKLVDELYGPRGERDRLVGRAIVIEVGAPFPSGRDTMGILYDWCVRRIPSRTGAPGTNVSVWRDFFVRSDTGWRRVGHVPAVAPTGCTN